MNDLSEAAISATPSSKGVTGTTLGVARVPSVARLGRGRRVSTTVLVKSLKSGILMWC